MYNHKNHSEVFKRWCIALLIIVFVLGIIAGFVFKIEVGSLYIRERFNWELMLIIWFSEIIPLAVLYAVYAHLENQEIQINILNDIRSKLPDKPTPKRETSHSNPVDVFLNSSWTCSNCGKSNLSSATRCSQCNYER